MPKIMTKNNETIDLKEYTDQYSAWLEPIDSFIKYAADGVSKNHFFDFGCGIGPWVMMSTKTFNESTGADFKFECEKGIELSKLNKLENINFIEYKNGISDLSYFSIKPINLMVCIMVIELIPSKDVIELFKFASKNIENNGRFLILTRKRIGFLRTLLTFERFRYENPIKALRTIIGLFRGFFISIFSTNIKSSKRPRFFHNKREIINLAKKYDFNLFKGPKELSNLEFVNALEDQITPEKFFGFKQANWFIFEKNK